MLDKIWRFLKQLIQRIFRAFGKDSYPPLTPPLVRGGNKKENLSFPLGKGGDKKENFSSSLAKGGEQNLASPLTKGGLRGVLPTLTDAEYESMLMELLEGVNQGWGRGAVVEFLIAKQIKNGDLAAWLRRFGVRSLEGAQGSTEGGHGGTAPTNAVVSLQELARRLELLGRVAGGELGEVAGNVGREILVEFPVVSDEGDEEVDREAKEWFDRGYEQCMKGDFEGGIASFDKALEFKPDLHAVWYNRGNTLVNLGRFEDAIASYDKTLEFRPDDDAAWNNRGNALRNLGLFEEAISSYNKALELKPDKYTAWNNLGYALDNLGLFEKAISSYDKALGFQLNFHTAWYNRGITLRNLRRLEEAIASYDKALEIKPDYYEAWDNRGVVLGDLELFEEAIISCNKALEIKPDNYESWINRGLILRNLGLFKEAIASCDKALEIKSDLYEAWNNRGLALFNLGLFEEAIASYDKALEIKPYSHEAWINRGYEVKNAPRHNQVIYEMLQAKFPKSPAVIRTLITHKLTQRGYEEQILTLQAGLQYCPRDTHAEGYGLLHQALGNAHYDEGKFNSSFSSYNEALTTLTKDAFLKLHLEVLQKLIKTLVRLKQSEEVKKLQRGTTDLLYRLLREEDYSQLSQQQLNEKLVSFQQLTVNIFIQSRQFAKALVTAETDKNVCLSWLLDAWPPDYETKETVTYAQIQQLLNPETAAIYWHLSDAALTTFIIKSDGFLSPENCLSDFPDKFEKWVKDWNKQYNDYKDKDREKKNEKNHYWRDEMANEFDRLKKILLIDVIEQQLEGITDLILIPHRDLHRFPIHTLFSRDLNFVVSYLPSAKLGITLKDRFLAKAKEKTREANFILSIENPDSETIDQKGNPQPFPTLPAAEIESEIICRMFPNSTRRGKENSPTLDEVETLLLEQQHKIFHFTGHGSYNFDNPVESTLYLSKTDRLTVREIIKHNLSNYELICLPACETALTDKQTILAEYVGLTSGFMRAGVGCVVSTLWPIESGPSTLLMIYFYQRWREAGDSLPVALANAQKWLREATHEDLAAWYQGEIDKIQGEIDKITGNSSKQYEDAVMLIEFLKTDRRELDKKEYQPYKHPYYWAAFTITGLL